MQTVEKIQSEAVGASAGNFFINTMAVTWGMVVLVLICMATSGLDMSAGFF